MVAPAADTLECESCHTTDGRLDFVGLGFDEERVAELTVFPPGPPETTTTTTEATTTTTAPATTTTTAIAAEPVEEGSSAGLVVGIVAGVAVLGGLASALSRRRTT